MHRFIAELLHPNVKVSSSYFPAPQIFWDRLVQYGSSQLVLPAIYGSLKRKKLIDHSPKDLISYLQEIINLNQKRNTSIIKQIDFLSEIFNKHQINHVFLKGAAMLITKPYDAISERMIGDIDILVSEKDLLRAQQFLIDEGFEAVSKNNDFTKGLDSAKHLNRIASPNFTAAVEIHRRLLDYTLKNSSLHLEVLNHKLQTPNGFYVPSQKYLWQHAILNWQYNDSGIIRNALSFRSMVDVLYLEPKDITTRLKIGSNAVKHFYSLLSMYYEIYYTYYPFSKLRYKWQLSNKYYNKLNDLYFRLHLISNIAFLRMGSRTYRKRVLKNPKLLFQKILNIWNK